MRLTLPLAVAVLAFGVSFGVLARTAGLGVLAPVVMSATTFAGSSQFAAVSILGAGGGVAAAIVAAVLLNTRYAPIGLAAAPALRGGRVRRALEAQLVVDESWALAKRAGGHFDRGVLMGAGLTLYVAWLTGTAVGAVAGEALGDPEALGLDAAFPASSWRCWWRRCGPGRPRPRRLRGRPWPSRSLRSRRPESLCWPPPPHA